MYNWIADFNSFTGQAGDRLRDLVVMKGSNVSMSCTIFESNATRQGIVWTVTKPGVKNEETIFNGFKLSEKFSNHHTRNGSYVLDVYNITLDDAGTYTCLRQADDMFSAEVSVIGEC